jgi:hypothetical protein
MKPLTRLLPVLTLLAVLAGCAMPHAIPLNSSADDLMRKLGKPTETMANPKGGEYWDYAFGPEGLETWRFGVDSARVVRSAEQLLTYERLYKVEVGVSTEAQVRDLLGKPGRISENAFDTSWEWRVNLSPNLGHFVVSFDKNGKAKSTMVIIDSSMDNGSEPSEQ